MLNSETPNEKDEQKQNSEMKKEINSTDLVSYTYFYHKFLKSIKILFKLIKVQDLSIIEELMKMVLEIINSSLTNNLHHNSNLIYSLLYNKILYNQFHSHPTFQDVLQNINLVNSFDYINYDYKIFLNKRFPFTRLSIVFHVISKILKTNQ